MDVLLTGFEGYGAHGVNPTEEIVRAFDETEADGLIFSGSVLPVVYAGLADRIRALLDDRQPDIAILLGLWPGEACIRVERFALNRNDFEIADNAGVMEAGEIRAGAALAYESGLPVGHAVDDLLAAGIPARASSSAGNFLCNAIFFEAMEAVAQSATGILAGFVHVPYLPSQVAQILANETRLERHQRADLASMALETQIAAIRVVARAAKLASS